MRRRGLRGVVSTVALIAVTPIVAGPAAHAAAGAVVFPGMEIHQETTKCTLGFVDVQTRTAYTAGHCRGSGVVGDTDGNVVGHQTLFRDDTPNGATISTDHMISDWETIALSPDAQVNDVLPGGRALVMDPSVTPHQGQRVCHFGVVTGESCGTVEAVNNGWFTMANGVVSQRGDSGGPVYVLTDDGRAVIIGMFNSTWGQYPAAVSWTNTDAEIHQDAHAPAAQTVVPQSGTLPPA